MTHAGALWRRLNHVPIAYFIPEWRGCMLPHLMNLGFMCSKQHMQFYMGNTASCFKRVTQLSQDVAIVISDIVQWTHVM